jgi:hypothetical protein
MTEILTKLVVNCSTGESQVVALTDEEIAQRESEVAAAVIAKAEQDAIEEAKATAKASAEAKLAALGLTVEEIAAL